MKMIPDILISLSYRKIGERIKNRKDLERRPKAATARRAYGHWETDTLVAGDRTYGLHVLVERKYWLTHISFLENKTATTQYVIRRRPKRYPDTLRQSLTYDNGSGNSCYEAINAVLGTKSFFSAPSQAGEREC